MGLFDDAETAMRKQASKKIKEEVDQEAERDKATKAFADELQIYVATRLQRPDITISILPGVVSISDKNKKLKVKCDGPDAFTVYDNVQGLASTSEPITEIEAAKKVIDWLHL